MLPAPQAILREAQQCEEISYTHVDDRTPSDAFFAVDLECVLHKYRRWHECFPRVKPFYGETCSGGFPTRARFSSAWRVLYVWNQPVLFDKQPHGWRRALRFLPFSRRFAASYSRYYPAHCLLWWRCEYLLTIVVFGPASRERVDFSMPGHSGLLAKSAMRIIELTLHTYLFVWRTQTRKYKTYNPSCEAGVRGAGRLNDLHRYGVWRFSDDNT